MSKLIILSAILAHSIIATSQAQAQCSKLFCNAKTITGQRAYPIEKTWIGGNKHRIKPEIIGPIDIEPVILYSCTYDSSGNEIACIEVGSYIPGLPLNEL